MFPTGLQLWNCQETERSHQRAIGSCVQGFFVEECTLLTPGEKGFKILTGRGNECMMHALVRFAPLGVSPELFRVPCA